MVIEIHMLTPKLSILDCEILWLPIIYQNHFTNDNIFDKKPGMDPKKRVFEFLWKQYYLTQNAFSIVLIEGQM